jgi:hypothetical protein
MWRKSPIDDRLLNALRQYRRADEKECLFFGIKNGTAICILQEVFGIEGKPPVCVLYPNGKNKGICERLKLGKRANDNSAV